MSPQLRRDLRALLDYNWEDEEEDYKEHPHPRHVFKSMQRLDRMLRVEEGQ